MRYFAVALAALCMAAPDFPGTYKLIAYAEPGTHVPSAAPREMRGMTLILREDGSATMHIPGSADDDSELEYVVNRSERTATITDGKDVFLARFSHDTLVTRVPGGGPAFYWKRKS